VVVCAGNELHQVAILGIGGLQAEGGIRSQGGSAITE
jgi:hypothetical protein